MTKNKEWQLHRIASRADTSSPDDTAALLGTYPTRDAAVKAARALLRDDAEQWLQVCQDGGQGEDITL